MQEQVGFVALSRFVVVNEKEADVKAAFRARPRIVEDAPGFVSLQVISPLDRPSEIWLLTHWTDETSFREWHKSHAYRAAHHQIPRGLKLDPKETQLRFFEHVCT